MEHVNHPKHYNQHPAGIECIDIIRHYTCDIANAIKYLWRAGLKPEMGKEDAEKEIEDLKKALWYIEDYAEHYKPDAESIMAPIMSMTLKKEKVPGVPNSMSDYFIKEQTGHDIIEIIEPYNKDISVALGCLLHVGLIYDQHVLTPDDYKNWLDKATKAIQQRILDIECNLLNNEIEATKTVMHGYAVDGEDYVSKPGCVRETEPEHYDPLNMIVAWGRVYSLTDEVRKKDNGALYSPCENCDLWSECHDWKDMPTPMLDESKCHYLCARIHNANEQQYYKEVGKAKYSPKFGTVEVVDEMKELKQKMKQLQEEEE